MAELVGPTAERAQHTPIHTSNDVLTYDHAGRAQRTSAVPRTIDLLGSLARRGAITKDEARAGNRFRSDFREARCEHLKSAVLTRTSERGFTIEFTARQIDSRDRLYAALNGIGGVYSKEGCCLYHVIGHELTLKRWTHEMRRCKTPETASRILVRALKQLAKYYGDGS